MTLAYIYTHHNTLVAMLAFFAVLVLIALIVRQVELRRQQWHPYFRLDLPRVRSGFGTSPMMYEVMTEAPRNLYEEYTSQLGKILQAELLEDMNRQFGPPRMINAWEDLMEADWA